MKNEIEKTIKLTSNKDVKLLSKILYENYINVNSKHFLTEKDFYETLNYDYINKQDVKL
jgi:hypothetical protein